MFHSMPLSNVYRYAGIHFQVCTVLSLTEGDDGHTVFVNRNAGNTKFLLSQLTSLSAKHRLLFYFFYHLSVFPFYSFNQRKLLDCSKNKFEIGACMLYHIFISCRLIAYVKGNFLQHHWTILPEL